MSEIIDLPAELEPDCCIIEENPVGRRPYKATPYQKTIIDEPDGSFEIDYEDMEFDPRWEPSSEYIEYVRSNSDIEEDIQFLRSYVTPISDDVILSEEVFHEAYFQQDSIGGSSGSDEPRS